MRIIGDSILHMCTSTACRCSCAEFLILFPNQNLTHGKPPETGTALGKILSGEKSADRQTDICHKMRDHEPPKTCAPKGCEQTKVM